MKKNKNVLGRIQFKNNFEIDNIYENKKGTNYLIINEDLTINVNTENLFRYFKPLKVDTNNKDSLIITNRSDRDYELYLKFIKTGITANVPFKENLGFKINEFRNEKYIKTIYNGDIMLFNHLSDQKISIIRSGEEVELRYALTVPKNIKMPLILKDYVIYEFEIIERK